MSTSRLCILLSNFVLLQHFINRPAKIIHHAADLIKVTKHELSTRHHNQSVRKRTN